MPLHRREMLFIFAPVLLFVLIHTQQRAYTAGEAAVETTSTQPAGEDIRMISTATPTSSSEIPTTDPGGIAATVTITGTTTISPTATITGTITVVPSETPTIEPTLMATPNPFSYLPLIVREPTPLPYIPPEKVLFCDSLVDPLYIPDNSPFGISNEITVYDTRLIVDLDIALRINHTWVGDLVVNLTHSDTGKMIYLIDRPGIPASSQGCDRDNIFTILDDEISSYAEGKCAAKPAAISGVYIPNQPLNAFDGDPVAGTWRLDVFDHYKNDTGALSEWCLVASISPYGQMPTPTLPPPPPPPQTQISGVTGRDQALPLDCESRSAVDWASYFGYGIGEISFFNQLPHSDNPDTGFVGNVYDPWGHIPPRSYGVHAEPVAALLRAYGLPAYAHRPLSWDHLRAEIAAGRPVIVWIIGSVENGIPVYFTPPDGMDTIVARYEHTVIVTGYSESKVWFLNGDTIYTRTVEEFLDSWSVLGNMAITASP